MSAVFFVGKNRGNTRKGVNLEHFFCSYYMRGCFINEQLYAAMGARDHEGKTLKTGKKEVRGCDK